MTQTVLVIVKTAGHRRKKRVVVLANPLSVRISSHLATIEASAAEAVDVEKNAGVTNQDVIARLKQESCA